MVIPTAVAYGVLAFVGLVVLVAFVVVFTRLERAQQRLEEDWPPMPVGWPVSTADAPPSAPPMVRPGGLRDPDMVAPQPQKKPS